MAMNQFKGMYAALISGISDDGEFSPERQRNIDEYVLRQGLKGIYVGGSSGESGLFTVDELLDQQAVVAENAKNHDCTLIAHVGAPNLRDSVRLAQSAKDRGYHALSALPPHAYPFSDQEILSYYRVLSSATDLPLIVYEVPIRTGRPIPDTVLIELLELKNVMGVKFTSSDLFKMCRLQTACPDKAFYFGFDEIFLSAAALGVDGGIGTTYNVLGKLYARLFEATQSGDFELARRLQSKSQQFVTLLFETGVLPGVKVAMQAIGVDCGPTRAPFQLQSQSGADAIKKLMRSEDFTDWIS